MLFATIVLGSSALAHDPPACPEVPLAGEGYTPNGWVLLVKVDDDAPDITRFRGRPGDLEGSRVGAIFRASDEGTYEGTTTLPDGQCLDETWRILDVRTRTLDPVQRDLP